MEHRDRQTIELFNVASNGLRSTKAERGKKRARDDGGTTGGTLAPPRRSLASPYAGLSQTNLHQSNRSNNAGAASGSRSNQTSAKGQSRTLQRTWAIAGSVFPASHNSPKSSRVESENESEAVAPINYSSSNNVLRYPDSSATLPLAEGLSPETNATMSGKQDEMFVFSDMMDAASVPASLHRDSTLEDSTPTRRRKSSSADPIDMIDKTSSGPSIVTVDTADTDSIEEIVEVPRTGQLRPGTPKKQTMFEQGRVERIVASVSQAGSNAQPTLGTFLKPQSLKSSRPPFESVEKRKSSSTGQAITPGMTRKPIAKSMGMKSRLKIHQTGSGALATYQPPPKTKEPSPKRQLNTTPSLFKPIKLPIQEWYCAFERRASSRDGQELYYLIFNGAALEFVREKQGAKKSVAAWKMTKLDFIGFEVAATNADGNKEESLTSIYFTLTDKYAKSDYWKKLSNEDTTPKMLVTLSVGADDITQWEMLIDRLASWSTKATMNIVGMRSIINELAHRSTAAHAEWRAANSKPPVLEPEAPPESPIPQVASSRDRAPTSTSRMRTRAAIPNSKNEKPKPSAPPLQDPDEIILVYPQSGTGAVNINRAELARLEPGEFLNDTLIELGLKLWLNELRAKDPELVEQVHVFNSFFFKKLDGGRGQPCDYKSVKKWTSKLDLFQKKFIIVPINEHLHWYLAIICFPEYVLQAPAPQPPQPPTRKTRSSGPAVVKTEEARKSPESEAVNEDSILEIEDIASPTEPGHMDVDNDLADQSQKMAIDTEMTSEPLQVQDSTEEAEDETKVETPILDMTKEDDEEPAAAEEANSKKCWIIILDSLRGKHNRTVRILREYLQAEAQERRGVKVETKDTKSSGGLVEDKHLSAPEQPNWCDCGVYLLHYAETFLANPLKILALPTGAKRTHPELYSQLWRQDEVSKKRDVLRNTVNQLSAEWVQSKLKIEPATQTDALKREQPSLEGDFSIMIIDPPPGSTSKGAASDPPSSPTSHAQRPPRTGLLPDRTDEDEVENACKAETSSDQSRTKGTRRGSKGGKKHQRPQTASQTASQASSVEL